MKAIGRAILIAQLLGPFALVASAEDAVSLDQAIREGKVKVEITALGGSTGDTILLNVQRQVPATLRLSLKPGTVFKSTSGRVQDMVGLAIKGERVSKQAYRRSDVILLRDDSRHAYVVEAYGLDFHKPNPGAGDRFTISSADSRASQILLTGKKQGATIKVLQIALWIDREDVALSQLKRRLTHHRNGSGANLLKHVGRAGIGWDVVRVWKGTRRDERKLKKRKDSTRICPRCAAKPMPVRILTEEVDVEKTLGSQDAPEDQGSVNL